MSEPVVEECFGENSPSKTIVTLPLVRKIQKNMVNVGANVGVNVGVNVGANAKRLLGLIFENPSVSAVAASEILGISKRQAERLFSQLKELNLIERIGPDKGGHWKINLPQPTDS